MPLYDMKCLNCGKEQEKFCSVVELHRQECSECGGRLKVLITNSHNQDWFHPHWNEHFTGEPIWVRTRGHLKELCLKHNVTSRALGDVRNISEI